MKYGEIVELQCALFGVLESLGQLPLKLTRPVSANLWLDAGSAEASESDEVGTFGPTATAVVTFR